MSIVPSQILYLEHGSSRLYAEAIQVISSRQICWARPTLLIQKLPENVSSDTRQAAIATAARALTASPLEMYDLEGCPDLIWPLAPFNIAYDLDFFSLLIQLKITPEEGSRSNGSGPLHEFTRSFWQTHPDLFKASRLETKLSSGLSL